MRVFVREAAARDLEGIFDWISRDNPAAAGKVLERLHERFRRLALSGFPDLGRTGSTEGTRELVEPPYIALHYCL